MLILFYLYSEPDKETSVYLGNIYPSTTIENLLDEFSKFGSIVSINIKYGNVCVNAFVEFCKPQWEFYLQFYN